MLPRPFQHCHLISDRDQSLSKAAQLCPLLYFAVLAPLQGFPKAHPSRINPRHLNPWLRLCIWDTWPKTRVTSIQGKYQPHSLFSALGGRDRGTEPHLLKNSHLLRVPLPSPFWSSWSFLLMQGALESRKSGSSGSDGLGFWLRLHPMEESLLWLLASGESTPSCFEAAPPSNWLLSILFLPIHSSRSLFKEANK